MGGIFSRLFSKRSGGYSMHDVNAMIQRELIEVRKTYEEDLNEKTQEYDALRAQLLSKTAQNETERENNRIHLESLMNQIKQDTEISKKNLEHMETQLKQMTESMERTSEELAKANARYNSVKGYFDEFQKKQGRTPVQTVRKVLLMGPKGSGKTTFAALRGMPVVPSNDELDGTKDIMTLTDPTGVEFMDTIGIGFDLRGMTKMMAYFMLTSFPTAVVCFCGARGEREYLNITQWFQISQPYMCEINGQRFNTDHHHPSRNPDSKGPSDFYREFYIEKKDELDIYPKKEKINHVTHTSNIDPNRGSFQRIQTFLCDGSFPDAGIGSQSYESLFKYQVFEQMQRLSREREYASDIRTSDYNFFNGRD